MDIRITRVHLEDGEGHEHITQYEWVSATESKVSYKPAMVDWVDVAANHAYVGEGQERVEVGVVRPADGQPYLRTYADGDWTNNLLALPRF